jgi:quercetin 2,3-dioxygenase
MKRSVERILKSVPTLEGAGVHLQRAFGFPPLRERDPFLLLDEFHSTRPADYLQGFPWHPHRGMETITYILQGEVEHGDSLGNKGTIGAGEVQWMTAGSGIIHQEMPRGDAHGVLWGFQLWANLPAHQKMMQPRYQEVQAAHLPEITVDGGVRIKVICGEVAGARGPVQKVVIEPQYLDITVPPHTAFAHPIKTGHTGLAYLYQGQCSWADSTARTEASTAIIFARQGDEITVTTEDLEARFLLISGLPIHEPVAWRGPIVMTTEAELQLAFQEYRQGTFLKPG